MKHHNYKINIIWDSETSGVTTGYNSYSRNHKISSKGKPTILASSDPAFRGDHSKYNPEELFLASISSCHMLWYLHFCTNEGITVLEYNDNTLGTMIEEGTGAGRFISVILNPTVKIKESDKVALAKSLHEKANEFCFIANSCNFKIQHHPIIVLQ